VRSVLTGIGGEDAGAAPHRVARGDRARDRVHEDQVEERRATREGVAGGDHGGRLADGAARARSRDALERAVGARSGGAGVTGRALGRGVARRGGRDAAMAALRVGRARRLERVRMRRVGSAVLHVVRPVARERAAVAVQVVEIGVRRRRRRAQDEVEVGDQCVGSGVEGSVAVRAAQVSSVPGDGMDRNVELGMHAGRRVAHAVAARRVDVTPGVVAGSDAGRVAAGRQRAAAVAIGVAGVRHAADVCVRTDGGIVPDHALADRRAALAAGRRHRRGEAEGRDAEDRHGEAAGRHGRCVLAVGSGGAGVDRREHARREGERGERRDLQDAGAAAGHDALRAAAGHQRRGGGAGRGGGRARGGRGADGRARGGGRGGRGAGGGRARRGRRSRRGRRGRRRRRDRRTEHLRGLRRRRARAELVADRDVRQRRLRTLELVADEPVRGAGPAASRRRRAHAGLASGHAK